MSLTFMVFTMAFWSYSVKENPDSQTNVLSHSLLFVLVDQDGFTHEHLVFADLASTDFKVVFVPEDNQQEVDVSYPYIEWMTNDTTVFSQKEYRFKYINRQGVVEYEAEHPPESAQLLRWALGAPVGERESVFLGKENVTLQQSHTDCAAACTVMLLARTGRPIPQGEVYAHLGRDIDFASLLDIKKFLTERGISSSGFRGSFTDLKREKEPVIIQVEGQHFVVLVGFVGDGAVILDPASGRYYLSREALKKKWNGFWLRIDETG